MSFLESMGKLLVAIFSILLHPVFLIPILVAVALRIRYFILRWKENEEYKKSTYHQITHLPFREVRKDKGRYGEYCTYKRLQHFEQIGARFLFNVYIPKGQDETTEIDVLMICEKGLFVIESKNYNGWIFGDESRKQWCQSLAVGRRRSHKEYFYNPIMQNRSHIKHLKELLGDQVPMHSVVVFSNRCKLKNLQVRSADVHVVDWDGVEDVVYGAWGRTPVELLAPSEIQQIYDKLYPFTQVDAGTKAKHVEDIRRKQGVQTDAVNGAVPLVQIQAGDAVLGQELTPPVVAPASGTGQEGSSENDVGMVVKAPLPAEEGPDHEVHAPECPRCGGSLVLRTAARGTHAGEQFYGCSNFPKCRYTRKNRPDPSVTTRQGGA